MYHYAEYDLQKVAKSLNEGITLNQSDIVDKSIEELNQILDNVWNDKTIPNRIKALKVGIPLSIAAVGGCVAGLPGLLAGGFLSNVGFKVIEKVTEVGTEELDQEKRRPSAIEKLAKIDTKSYQANIYDFKQKYKR